MPQKTTSETVPAVVKPQYDEIVTILDGFSAQHLNTEYAQVCRQMAAKLARKRPSPLSTGKANTWAGAIVHAVGTVNFLFDKTQTPHLRADELAAAFNLSKSTIANKSKQIRDMLKIGVFEPEWTLPSQLDQNPMAWMLTVNGFIIDARSAPRAIQQEAFRKGLIPYLPEER